MLFKNIALFSLAALVAANEAVPEAHTTLAAVPLAEEHSENPEDIKKFMHKKCPEEKCPKPKHVTLTKNITKVAYKTVTKTAGSCETQAPKKQHNNKKCGGKNC
ncbi:hypothetical protein CJU89_2335 [Yarrowia sp. B02]|nr:hypothetical protein CJU89_2335 [Yarrowia sp. B02]